MFLSQKGKNVLGFKRDGNRVMFYYLKKKGERERKDFFLPKSRDHVNKI